MVSKLSFATLAEVSGLEFKLESLEATIHGIHHDVRVKCPEQFADDDVAVRGSPVPRGLINALLLLPFKCIDFKGRGGIFFPRFFSNLLCI